MLLFLFNCKSNREQTLSFQFKLREATCHRFSLKAEDFSLKPVLTAVDDHKYCGVLVSLVFRNHCRISLLII